MKFFVMCGVIALATVGFSKAYALEQVEVIVKNNNVGQQGSYSQEKYVKIIVTKKEGESESEFLDRVKLENSSSVALLNAKIKTPLVKAATVFSQPFLSAYSSSEPNDPYYIYQRQWFEKGPETKGSSNIIGQYNISNKTRTVRVGIIDGGFRENDDIKFVEGINLFNTNESSNYLTPLPLTGCGSELDTHGTAVSSIIGAKTNNNYLIAGISDVDMVAVKALECGTGDLYSLYLGIRYLSGSNVSGIGTISKPVDIINISLGAEIDCPSIIQEALDEAYIKNIPVVVSAGNEDDYTFNKTPAGCNNIINVSAVDITNEKASFSNYGDEVDVTALGVSVAVIADDDESAFLANGTSFTAPLTTGVIAKALSEYDVVSSEYVESLLKFTSTKLSKNSTCLDDECGVGLVEAEQFHKILGLFSNKKDDWFFSPVIDSSDRDPDLYNTVLGTNFMSCDTQEIDISLDDGLSNVVYKFYAFNKSDTLDISNAEIVYSGKDSKFILNMPDYANYNYGFSVCSEEAGCNNNTIIPFPTSIIKTGTCN